MHRFANPARFAPRGEVVREDVVDLRLDDRRDVVVVGGEHAACAEQPRGLGQHRAGVHPVERLRAGDEIGHRRGEAGVGGEGLDVLDVRLPSRRHRAFDHVRVRLDADDAIGAIGPGTRRQARPRAQVDDQARLLDLGDQRQDVEELPRRREPVPVVELREGGALVAGAFDQGAGEVVDVAIGENVVSGRGRRRR